MLEFAVISTDKGEAVDVLREQTDATAVVFFGDDVTDEKAFRRMRDADVGVKVGPGETLGALPRIDVARTTSARQPLSHTLLAAGDRELGRRARRAAAHQLGVEHLDDGQARPRRVVQQISPRDGPSRRWAA